MLDLDPNLQHDNQLRAGAEVLLHLPANVSRVAPPGHITHQVTSSSTVGTRGGRGEERRSSGQGKSRNSCFPFLQCVWGCSACLALSKEMIFGD